MSNTAPSRADPVVVFPLGRWCPPQKTSQPHPPQGLQTVSWVLWSTDLDGDLLPACVDMHDCTVTRADDGFVLQNHHLKKTAKIQWLSIRRYVVTPLLRHGVNAVLHKVITLWHLNSKDTHYPQRMNTFKLRSAPNPELFLVVSSKDPNYSS